MATLLEKIEASAKQRLSGKKTSSGIDLASYRTYLKVETHRLKIQHRGGAEGVQVCRARATMMDFLLRHLLDSSLEGLETQGKGAPPRWALVAIGGYGRGELNPCSDIDIMFLHNEESGALTRGRIHPYLAALAERMLYPLWDLGIKVGHSVRSLEDCVKVANADMQSKTSLLEARHVAGDKELFERMESVFLARCVRGFEQAYIQSRLEDQAKRRAKFGNSACMQEPNLKNGCGGLRDYQNLLWMAFFKYRCRGLHELHKQELVTTAERKQLEQAYDFLMRVRTEIHYTTNRPADVLLRALQPKVAWHLGHRERSIVRRIEGFMREVYTHLRAIHLLTRSLEQRLALLPNPGRRLASVRDLISRGHRHVRSQQVDGFRFFRSEIHPLSTRIFRDKPRRLMRVFFYAQQRGLSIHPDVSQMIRNHLSLVDKKFLSDERVRNTFLEILSQRGNVAPIVRAMHEVGFLGKYLPEFGKLTCLVQHEFYHQYTTDEHTLACLDHLDAVWESEATPYRHYTEMLDSLERPSLLYLALLLHDAGKASKGQSHARAGSDIALAVSRRLGLDGSTAHTLRLLVEHHLLLAVVSQRHDLEDQSVIRNVGRKVENCENLKMLTLHTLVDSLGTSRTLWNDFKDSLLRQLYQKVKVACRGETSFRLAEEKGRELLEAQVSKSIPRTVGQDEVEAHFENLPKRYFHIHSAEDIVRDLKLANAFMRHQLAERERALLPVVAWRNHEDRGFTELKVCTWDRQGLFEKVAGSLAAADLNILSAQIFTRLDGVVLDTFGVIDSRSGLLVSREARQKFERVLVRALNHSVDLETLFERRKPSAPLYDDPDAERIEPVVHLDNHISDTRTVVHVEAEDHVGLLFTICRVLTELNLDISVAKICTEKGAAIDSFYVQEQDRSKIRGQPRKGQIRRELLEAIQLLEEK